MTNRQPVMPRVIKRAFLRAVLLVCALLIPACAASPAGRVLIVWHTFEGARERALLRLIDRFNTSNHDGIYIVPERRTRVAQHEAMLGNHLPHLALVSQAQAALYDAHSQLTPLDTIIAADADAQHWGNTDRADLFPFVLRAGRNTRGQLVGLPMGGDMRVLLRNRDWASSESLGDMPTTWEEFSKSCVAALSQSGGFVCFALTNPGLATGTTGDATFLEEWATVQGAPPYALDTNTLRIDTPQMAQAVSQLLSYLQSGAAYRAQSSQRALEDFAAGRVSYLSAPSSQIGQVLALIRTQAKFNIDVGTWPVATGASKPASLIAAPLWVIPKTTPVASRDAWRFVRWLLETDQTAQWAADTGEVPARASAVNALNLDPTQVGLVSAEAARGAVLMRVAPYALPLPVQSGWPCVQMKLADSLRQVTDGQSITDTLTLAQSSSQDVLGTDCSNK